MRWHSRAAGIALVAVALCSVLPARDAAARKFQMSGTWIMRRHRIFVVLMRLPVGDQHYAVAVTVAEVGGRLVPLTLAARDGLKLERRLKGRTSWGCS